MSTANNERRRKTGIIGRRLPPNKAAHLQRARDLVAAGNSWREVQRETGIHENTLKSRAKREGWYVPPRSPGIDKSPPPIVPEQPAVGESPPEVGLLPTVEGIQRLLAWACNQSAKLCRGNHARMLDLVKVLSDALKATASAKIADAGNSGPGKIDDASLKKIFDDAMACGKVPTRPIPSAFERGEVPATSK